jgi:hypothetical protein
MNITLLNSCVRQTNVCIHSFHSFAEQTFKAADCTRRAEVDLSVKVFHQVHRCTHLSTAVCLNSYAKIAAAAKHVATWAQNTSKVISVSNIPELREVMRTALLQSPPSSW